MDDSIPLSLEPRMSITLDLPEELVGQLSTKAAQLGVPLNEYARRVLSSAGFARGVPRTGAEIVAAWQAEGLIGTRSDITDSQQHARDLRARAERRTRN